MSMSFTKLFSSITESTIWAEDDKTRLVWITMLAMADRMGRVWASVPGLANRARVPVDSVIEALGKFQSPDPFSRTKDHEGKRIEEIDGGWRLLNHQKYRKLRDQEAIRESKRNHINAKRARERAEKEKAVDNVDRGRHIAEAEAEADPLKKKFLSPAQIVVHNQELDRVRARIKELKESYDSHQTMDTGDTAELKNLKARKKELQELLGVVA